jgi:tRNA dimethylallyltransferase
VRIAERARRMFEAGWLDEVRALLRDGYGDTRPMGAVGYKQVAEALRAGPVDEPALLDSVIRATRIFARRQRTWLRDEKVQWLEPPAAGSFEV